MEPSKHNPFVNNKLYTNPQDLSTTDKGASPKKTGTDRSKTGTDMSKIADKNLKEKDLEPSTSKLEKEVKHLKDDTRIDMGDDERIGRGDEVIEMGDGKSVENLREEVAAKCANINFNKLSNITAASFKEKCAIATLPELEVLNDILDAGGNPEEILKGAHFFINDNGDLFQKWAHLDGVSDRSNTSSHHNSKSVHGATDQNQYEISGNLAPAILFGQTSKQAGSQTWVQLEKTPFNATDTTDKVKNFFGHGFDFITYKVTGENVGPYGTSVHVESNQINLNPKM